MDGTWTRDQLLSAVIGAFATLGVPPTSDRTVIKKAFRHRAAECHPDKNPGANHKACEDRFKALVNARDLCLDASGVEALMDDLRAWETSSGSEGRRSQPMKRSDSPTSGSANAAEESATWDSWSAESVHESHSADQEWRVFVDHPAAYLSIFALSASAVAVTVTMSLSSAGLTIAGVFVCVLAMGVVTAVSFVLSALAISIPVFGWIALAAVGLKVASAIFEAGSESLSNMAKFVTTELSRTAYPHKALRFSWWASNLLPIVGALFVGSDFLYRLMAMYLIVNNVCFHLLSEKVSNTLTQIEAEYDRIRNRSSDTAIIVRSKDRFGSYTTAA